MNKKVYTIILMVVLMVVIVLMKNLFVKNIEEIAISNNNIESFNKNMLREGKYSFSLPSGWDIDNPNNKKDDIIATFNNKEDIYGSISIVNSNIDTIYNNIKGDIVINKNIKDLYNWRFIAESNGKDISNYYIRDYSEGKVLIIKFSYREGKEKKSIKVVFEYIAKSFI